MKKILFVLICVSFVTKAQVPYAISYQGLVRNANNVVVANSTISLRISIIKTTATGTIVYVETHNTATDGNGIFTVKIGAGSSSDNFTAINWLADKYFLKREIDPAGGSNYTISGTTQFLSAPYSLYANNAEGVLLDDGKVLIGNSSGTSSDKIVGDDMTISNIGLVTISSGAVGGAEILDNSLSASDLATSAVGSDEIANGSITDTDLDKVNIPLSGFSTPDNDLNGNNQLLVNIDDPLNNQDAATKAYVDDVESKLYLLTVVSKLGRFESGGIIAYFLSPGDDGYDPVTPHGLIVSTADQSTSAYWGCLGVDVGGASGASVGTGTQNTIDIIAGCAEAGIAARLCDELDENGYSDWFLPSIEELERIYENISIINEGIIANGGAPFASAFYNSSTENSINESLGIHFGNGSKDFHLSKNNAYHVRSVRAF
ncbi:MAG: DUF1566 domain-containing protein [Imperialibacter sp.]|uniref:Lcl domain-containing protein n=1 Tax=Imperialibacter sp. TaxID=2038411 RepID=UPI0032ED6BCF